jgi:phage terminase large subunit-like protein
MQWCTQQQVRGITLREATFGSLSILLTLLNPKKLTILVCVIEKPKDPHKENRREK